VKTYPMPELDVAAKFLLGLFLFLALAACVAVLGGCSSGSAEAACPAQKHAVYLKSAGFSVCAENGSSDPCLTGSDCPSSCCDAVNGDVNNLRCLDPSIPDPKGWCMCPSQGARDCPMGDSCGLVPEVLDADGGMGTVYACTAG
jgi:hypothetical protein